MQPIALESAHKHFAFSWPSMAYSEPLLRGTNTGPQYRTLAPIENNGIGSAIIVLRLPITNSRSNLQTFDELYRLIIGANQITSNSAPHFPHQFSKDRVVTPHSQLGESDISKEVSELRLVTGFTWDQVARLFNVSRRSVHHWASGGAISSENEEHLHRVLAIIRRLDCGRTGTTRAALLIANGSSAQCAFDLLVARDYQNALRALELNEDSPVFRTPEFVPSKRTLSERVPPPPDVLMDVRSDDEPLTPRRARAIRYRKVARGS